REIGITPQIEPIRGGTDGARLTYMGLPCPNIGTGGYNFHGKYEYLSINEMDKSVELITRITGKLISN
ncbi:MAG TPA: peptidase T, partial [Clostridia bacterium]|nr:peptidase T [Clostridia bacterium]